MTIICKKKSSNIFLPIFIVSFLVWFLAKFHGSWSILIRLENPDPLFRHRELICTSKDVSRKRDQTWERTTGLSTRFLLDRPITRSSWDFPQILLEENERNRNFKFQIFLYPILDIERNIGRITRSSLQGRREGWHNWNFDHWRRQLIQQNDERTIIQTAFPRRRECSWRWL